VEEHETPSAEDAAAIAASTVFEPDAPEAPAAETADEPMPGDASERVEDAAEDTAADAVVTDPVEAGAVTDTPEDTA
jgi:hypothetical protein